MSAMNQMDKAFYNALVASTSLTSLTSGGTANPSVFQHLAPQDSSPPYVVYGAQSPSVPVKKLDGNVAYENALYMCKAVTEGSSMSLAGTIAARIDTALDVQLSLSGGFQHQLLIREQDIDYVEVVAGKRFNHRGAIYRVQVR